MGIAVLIFFIAIFVGVLFVGGLIWLIFRRGQRPGAENRNFSGGANYGGGQTPAHKHFSHTNDEADAKYAGGALFDQRNSENYSFTETAQDSPYQSESTYSHESHGAGSAPGYANDGSSSYDSGSSDSSSSDSGSSSSDSGSSSSSSD